MASLAPPAPVRAFCNASWMALVRSYTAVTTQELIMNSTGFEALVGDLLIKAQCCLDSPPPIVHSSASSVLPPWMGAGSAAVAAKIASWSGFSNSLGVTPDLLMAAYHHEPSPFGDELRDVLGGKVAAIQDHKQRTYLITHII